MTSPAWPGSPGGQKNLQHILLSRVNSLSRVNLQDNLLSRVNLQDNLLSNVNNKKVGVDKVKEEKRKRSKQFLKTIFKRLKKKERGLNSTRE